MPLLVACQYQSQLMRHCFLGRWIKQQILPKKWNTSYKSRCISTSRSKEKEKKYQKPTLKPPIETKNKFKIEMDSTPTIKKPEQLKQKVQPPPQLARLEEYIQTEVISERPGSTFKLPPAKFDTVPSPSRTKSPMEINKQSNAQGSTKSLQRSHSIESMDSDTDVTVASLDLESITNNHKTWNHLAVYKQMSSIPFFKCYLQTIHFKSKNKITDKLISHKSCIFI